MGHNLYSAQEDLHLRHSSDAIQKRLEYGSQHSYLKDFVFGAIDGAVTTFAVVSGVAGAELSTSIVIILGLANLIGDGFSMAIGNFLGSRAEEQVLAQARQMEELHIDEVPEGEKEEVRQIYSQKGFTGVDLDRVVEVITSNRKIWIDTMLQEELGMSLDNRSPWKSAAATFISFSFVGAIPLVPFLMQWILPGIQMNAFVMSSVLTGVAFFLVGTLKSRFVAHPWYRSGFETFLAGSTAALIAYGIGALLKNIAPGV